MSIKEKVHEQLNTCKDYDDVLFTHSAVKNSPYKTLRKAIKANADLTNLDFTNEYIRGKSIRYDFHDADFSATRFDEVKFKRGTNFFNCRFDSSAFIDSTLAGCNFYDCDFTEANFERTVLSLCKFVGTHFSKTSFDASVLRHTEFEKCELSGTRFYATGIVDCCLTKGTLLHTIGSVEHTSLVGFRSEEVKFQANGCGHIGRDTTYFPGVDYVICGCFRGTLEQFRNKVNETYGTGVRYYSFHTDEDRARNIRIFDGYMRMYSYFLSQRANVELVLRQPDPRYTFESKYLTVHVGHK